MTECKYSLRHVLNSLENYNHNLDTCRNVDYWTRIKIKRNLMKMANNIREYLSLPIEVPKKQTIGEMFKNNIKYFGGD